MIIVVVVVVVVVVLIIIVIIIIIQDRLLANVVYERSVYFFINQRSFIIVGMQIFGPANI